MWNSRLVAGAFLITTLATLATCGYIHTLRNERDTAIASETKAKLEAAGFKETLSASPKEVIKLVPTLVTKEVIKLIHDKAIAPVTSAHIEAKTDITIPGGETPAQTPREIAIHLTYTADLLITRIKFGIATEWKGGVGGTWQVDGQEPQDLSFAPENTKVQIAFSDEIAKALYDHEREGGWLKRHTALVCPGVGVTYNPIDITRPVNIGVTCTYGFSWF